MIKLEVKNLHKRFGGLHVLKGVTFEINGPELIGLIGPNGAGKTTLTNVLAGEVYPTTGRIELFGSDVTRSGPNKKAQSGVGRTYQVTELFQELTVEDNLIIAAQAVTSSRFRFWAPVRVRGAVDEAIVFSLASVGLASERHTRVSELSHGEQRQLEIAMSLASNPKLLLLDEPAAGLSAAERKMMKGLINGLPRNLSIVLIEHDMDIALDLVERVLVLDNGRKIAEGDPVDIPNDQRVQDVYLKFD